MGKSDKRRCKEYSAKRYAELRPIYQRLRAVHGYRKGGGRATAERIAELTARAERGQPLFNGPRKG